MGLFKKEEPTIIVRKAPKQRTAEDIIKKTYLKTLRNNPELMTKIAMKESGHYEDFKEETDPVLKQQKEMNRLITEDALLLIKSDQNLRKQYAEKVAQKAIDGIDGRQLDKSDRLSPAGQLIQSLRELKELKEEFGDGNNENAASSGWGSAIREMLTQPEVASVLASTLRQIIMPQGNQVVQNIPQVKYVVMVDNKITEVNESQYNELVKIGKVKPVGLIESPKEAISKEPELPSWASEFNFDKLQEYLELTPEDLANQLKIESEGGKAPQLKVFWDFLMTADFDTLAKIIEPYKNDSKAGKFIQTLLCKKEWVEQVINIVKNTQVET